MNNKHFREKWGVSRSEGASLIIQATEKLIFKGEDQGEVEAVAREIMSDMGLPQDRQAKMLAIVNRVWRRHQDVVRGDGVRLEDVVQEVNNWWNGQYDSSGIPIGVLIDIRNKLSALVRLGLYHADGDKVEGRKALMARDHLDELFFNTTPNGNGDDGVRAAKLVRNAIILETLGEQADLLDQASEAARGSRKGIKAQMLKFMDDPDRFDRFNDEDKAAIRAIAHGMWFFAKGRLDRLNEAIRRRGAPYTG